jgi:hypothetical protein
MQPPCTPHPLRAGRVVSSALVALLLILTGSVAGAAEQPTRKLEEELKDQAPRILDYLRDHRYSNIGVLKFLVKKDERKPVTANAGVFNTTLANRLEIALILADDVRKPVGIIHNASGVAATLRGADHRTAKGREVLFKNNYALSWGAESVRPDAFLTGDVQFSPDYKTMSVRIVAFGPRSTQDEEVAHFTALCTAKTLGEAGKGFLRRFSTVKEGSEDDGSDASVDVQRADDTNPLNDPDRPVTLEIFYDDQKVFEGRRFPFKNDGGEALIPEPKEGQLVRFHLQRTEKAKGQGDFGVLLLVNGVNTVFQEQDRAPADYTKWILTGKPGEDYVDVRGFFVRKGKDYEMIPFKVFSDADSLDQANLYGAKAGQVLFEVYRQAQPSSTVAADSTLRGIGRGTLPPADKKIEELGQLKRLLLSPPKGNSRGMIGRSDERRKADLEEVPDFKCDPEPIMSATLRYYRR